MIDLGYATLRVSHHLKFHYKSQMAKDMNEINHLLEHTCLSNGKQNKFKTMSDNDMVMQYRYLNEPCHHRTKKKNIINIVCFCPKITNVRHDHSLVLSFLRTYSLFFLLNLLYINHNVIKCILSLYIYENKKKGRKRINSRYTLLNEYY